VRLLLEKPARWFDDTSSKWPKSTCFRMLNAPFHGN
jgi:hypothetical protein